MLLPVLVARVLAFTSYSCINRFKSRVVFFKNFLPLNTYTNEDRKHYMPSFLASLSIYRKMNLQIIATYADASFVILPLHVDMLWMNDIKT